MHLRFGRLPVLVELHPIVIFSVFSLFVHVTLYIEPHGLVTVHLFDKILPALQVLDPFVGSVLFHI